MITTANSEIIVPMFWLTLTFFGGKVAFIIQEPSFDFRFYNEVPDVWIL